MGLLWWTQGGLAVLFWVFNTEQISRAGLFHPLEFCFSLTFLHLWGEPAWVFLPTHHSLPVSVARGIPKTQKMTETDERLNKM